MGACWRVEYAGNGDPGAVRVLPWRSPEAPEGDRLLFWRVPKGSKTPDLINGAVVSHVPADVDRVMRQARTGSAFVLFIDGYTWAAAWPPARGCSLPPLLYDSSVVEAAELLERAIETSGGIGPEPGRLWHRLVDALAHFQDTDFASSGGGASALSRPGERPGLALIRHYLTAEPDDPLTTLEDLSRATGLSRFQLVRLVSGATGLPPHQLRVRTQLWHARRLLEEGDTPACVAQRAGFVDQSHLTNWFRRVYGVTPATFGRHVV